MGSATKPNVYFFFETAVNLKNRTDLKKHIEKMFKSEGYGLQELRYIFCTDKRLLEINKKFLQHDFYTDIITFPLSEPSAPIEGEIYISIDRVRENAKHLNETFSRELLRVIFHGALHLCGYRDKTRQEKQRMRKAEERYINKYVNS